MAKLNLYVPDDLKAEMDAVSDLDPNWSAVAQEAFRLECQRLQNRNRSKGKMDAVIERLRASKIKTTNVERMVGNKMGDLWALNHAEFEQLRNLADSPLDISEFDAPPNGAFTWSEIVHGYIEGEPRPDRAAAGDFWEAHGDDGKSYPSDAFVQGFVEGAIAVYEQVKDKL